MENFCEGGAEPDSLETCGDPPPPPNACEGYPDGWIESELTIGDQTTTTCVQDLTEDDARDCHNPLGYLQNDATGEQELLCGDDKAECEATGGTFGTFNGEQLCLPSGFPDDLPTCEGVPEIISTENGYGFACTPTPDDFEEQEEEIPGLDDEPTDTDGDGIPDHLDDDIDGDGILNDVDPDIDGDEIPNESDLTPEGEGDKSSVSGGLGCDVRPSCKGDAILCSINYQIWAQRCKDEKNNDLDKFFEDQPDENPGELDLSDGGELVSALDGAFLDGVNELTGEGSQGIESGTSALESAMTGILPTVSACQDFVINFAQGNIVISCEKLATFRDIIGWALYILTAWHLFMIATTPIESRV